MSLQALSKILSKAGTASAAHTPGVISSIGDLGESPDRSIIAKIGPVPVGFQLGTAMGFDGVPAFVLDVVLDPITYLSGGGGSLTKAARAGKVLRRAAAAAGRQTAKAGNKLDHITDFLTRVRKLSPEDVYAAQVRGLEQAGRVDTGEFVLMGRALRQAKSDEHGADILKKLSDMDRAARFKALRRMARDRGPRGLDEAAAAGRKAESSRIGGSLSVPESEQIDRVLRALRSPAEGETGLQAAYRQIGSEIAQRRQVQELARKAKTAPSPEAFREFATQLAKLDPSTRAQIALQKTSIDDVTRAVAAIQVGKGAQLAGRAGERGLAHFSTPLGSFSLGTGELAQRIPSALKNTPIVRDLVNRSRAAGLVPGARAGRELRDEALLLQEFRNSSAPIGLVTNMGFAAKVLRGIRLDDNTFTSINRAWASDLTRSAIAGSKVGDDIAAYGSKFNWSNQDLWNLIQLVDDPRRFTKSEGSLLHQLTHAVEGKVLHGADVVLSDATAAEKARFELADTLQALAKAVAVTDTTGVPNARKFREELANRLLQTAEGARDPSFPLDEVARDWEFIKGRYNRFIGSKLDGNVPPKVGGKTSPVQAFTDLAPGTAAVKTDGRFIFRGAKLNALGQKHGLTDAHLELAEYLSRFFEQSGKSLLSQGAIDEAITDYFPRSISFVVKGKEGEFEEAMTTFFKTVREGKSATSTSTFLAHGIPRLGLALRELAAMEARGIIKLEKNPATIVKRFIESAGAATANARLLRRLSKATYTPDITQAAKKLPEDMPMFLVTSAKEGEKALSAGEKAALAAGEYINVSNNDRLMRLIREIGKHSAGPQEGLLKKFPELSKGNLGSGQGWASAQQAWVPKHLAKPLEAVIGREAVQAGGKATQGLNEATMRAALQANAVAKRSLLLVSAFHHMALTESAVATLGAKAFMIPGKVGRKIRGGQPDFFRAMDVVDHATRHGLQLGAPIDPQLDDVQKVLSNIDTKIGTNLYGTVGKGLQWWDRNLWDYYHNGLKLTAYHELNMRALGSERFKGMKANVLAQGVAEHVNNAFGGQVWRNFFVGRRGEQFGRLFLLAPDWTASNIRVASDVLTNQLKRSFPQVMSLNNRFPITTVDLMRADIRATYSRQYALRATLAAWLGWNFMNWALTSFNGGDIDFSKGRFMDQNPEGFRTTIDTGFSDAGKQFYLKPGKQFREPFELIRSSYEGFPLVPGDFLNRKSAPSVKAIQVMATGEDYFGQPIVETEDGPVSRIGKALGYTVTNNLPIPLQQMLDGKPGIGAASGLMGLPLRTGEIPDQMVEGIRAQLSYEPYVQGLQEAQEQMMEEASRGRRP